MIENVSKNSNAPISEEFSLVHHDYRLGSDVQTAILKARDRLSSKLFDLFSTALIVNREKGGNLPEALETMSASFKEIARLEEKVITASAEGRKGIRIISVMPIMIFVFVMMAQPQLIDTLTSHFVGWILITISVILYIVALIWVRKLLDIDI